MQMRFLLQLKFLYIKYSILYRYYRYNRDQCFGSESGFAFDGLLTKIPFVYLRKP
jgi:hypothetical protein